MKASNIANIVIRKFVKVKMALRKEDYLILFIYIIIYAFLIRGMMVAESRDFWHDEAFQHQFSQEPVTFILESNDVHPPLFTLLTKGFITIFNPSINMMRYSMVIISMLFIISFAFVIYRLWGREEALIATLMVALAPTFIFYSTEFRSYIFVMLLTIWQIYYFNLMIKFDRKFWSAPVGAKAGVYWVILSLLMIYSHYMAGLILLTQLIFLAIRNKKYYFKRWFLMGIGAIPLTYYLIMTLPKIHSFWFKDIDFLSLISTFVYIISIPMKQPIGWSMLVYGFVIYGLITFRKHLTIKHLQFLMYVFVPIITMWIFSQAWAFYHHRYFLFGGMMLFVIFGWAVTEATKRKSSDIEIAVIGLIIFLAVITTPKLLAETTNTEIQDASYFLYNHTMNATEPILVLHTSTFSQTPMKTYLPQLEHHLYTNLTKEQLFTAGGAVIKDWELHHQVPKFNGTIYWVSDVCYGEKLFYKGGLYVCRLV